MPGIFDETKCCHDAPTDNGLCGRPAVRYFRYADGSAHIVGPFGYCERHLRWLKKEETVFEEISPEEATIMAVHTG